MSLHIAAVGKKGESTVRALKPWGLQHSFQDLLELLSNLTPGSLKHPVALFCEAFVHRGSAFFVD